MLAENVLLEDSAGVAVEVEHGDIQRQDALCRLSRPVVEVVRPAIGAM